MVDRFGDNLDAFFAEEDSLDGVSQVETWRDSWIIDEPDENLRLAVRLPAGSSKPHREINLECLRGLGLRSVLADGLVQYAKERPAAVDSVHRHLVSGFVRFLSEAAADGGPRAHMNARDLAEGGLSSFADWIRTSTAASNTRRARASALKTILSAFERSAPAGDSDRTVVAAIRNTSIFASLAERSDKKTSSIKSTAKKAEGFLSLEHLATIIEAAERDVVRVTLEWKAAQRAIAEGRERYDGDHLYKLSAFRNSLPLCLACIERRCPDLMPTKEIADTQVRYAIRAHGIRTISKAFYASPEQMLPFILLLLLRTRYNVSTLLDLQWDEVADRGEVIALAPFKRRAERRQIRSEVAGDPLDPLSMRGIFQTLYDMTRRIRLIAPETCKARVFLTVPTTGTGDLAARVSSLVKTLSYPDKGAFAAFRERYQVGRFNVANLRTTLLDAIANGHDGLAGAQREGNHSEAVTTLSHYISVQTADNRRVTLAEMSFQSERWAATEGAMDPRLLPANSDLKSATPGFGCLAPFNSPLEGEVPGRLCRAQGHCARCPNAILRSDDPKLVAYVMAYAEAAASSDNLAPDTHDQLIAGYAALIAEVPPDVLTRAAALPKPAVQIS